MTNIDLDNATNFPTVTKAATVSVRMKNVKTGQIVFPVKYVKDAPKWGSSGKIEGETEPKVICLISQDIRHIHQSHYVADAIRHLEDALENAHLKLLTPNPVYSIKWITPDKLDFDEATIDTFKLMVEGTGCNLTATVNKVKDHLEAYKEKGSDEGSRFTPRAPAPKNEQMMLVCGELTNTTEKMWTLKIKNLEGNFAKSRCTKKGEYEISTGKTLTILNAPEWMVKKNWEDLFDAFTAKQDALSTKLQTI